MKNTDYIWWYNLLAVYTNLYFIIYYFSFFTFHLSFFYSVPLKQSIDSRLPTSESLVERHWMFRSAL